MTLGGILKHLAYVEDHWFSRFLHGRDPEPPWDTVDWDADHDWDMPTSSESRWTGSPGSSPSGT